MDPESGRLVKSRSHRSQSPRSRSLGPWSSCWAISQQLLLRAVAQFIFCTGDQCASHPRPRSSTPLTSCSRLASTHQDAWTMPFCSMTGPSAPPSLELLVAYILSRTQPSSQSSPESNRVHVTAHVPCLQRNQKRVVLAYHTTGFHFQNECQTLCHICTCVDQKHITRSTKKHRLS